MEFFFSVFLIGLWILFTIKFFQKIKEYNEYNSQKNTSFFLLCPLGIGLFYIFWGYFTAFWGENLLEDFVPFIYISLWTLIFGFPYILYSFFKLRACYKKYDLVYIIRTRSLNARKFVTFYIFLILFTIISYIFYFKDMIFNYFYTIVEPTFIFPFNLLLAIFGISLGYLFIRHAIFGSKRIIPEVSRDYIARRRRQLETMTSTPTRTTPRSSPAPTTTSTSRSTARRPSTVKVKRAIVRRPKRTVSASFERLKPKAGILSLEDFKCIFCFQLPQADEKRGIVLCPNCRHPAHADEFKDWSKASPLCSRCDASIPPSFRRNPKITSVKEYTEIINEFKSRKR